MHFKQHFGSSQYTIIQTYLTALNSEAFTPDIDPHVYAVYMVLKSVHNTVIEGFWRWLRVKMGLNLKLIILRGKENHIFDSNVAFHV